MLARVVKWEGGNAEAIRATAQEIQSRAATGPPEGVPAVGFTLLVNPEGGQIIAISLFKDEDDRRAGAAVLDGMTPPGDGFGERTSVGGYEVAVDIRAEE